MKAQRLLRKDHSFAEVVQWTPASCFISLIGAQSVATPPMCIMSMKSDKGIQAIENYRG